MSHKNKRVGIMMGGSSCEREISLKSGDSVFQNLKKAGWECLPLQVIEETEEEIRRLITESHIDVVFIAMHGGFGEGGRLQQILEKLGLPFTGSDQKSSRHAMDKIYSRRLFEKAKLCVPKYRWINRKSDLSVLNSLQYPLFVKPSMQGSSIGVSFVDSPLHLKEALDLAFKYDDDILVEEFMKGREMTVSVLDAVALPVVEIIPKKQFFDFQAKYEKGATEYVAPADIDEEATRRLKQDAVAAYRVLGCRHFGRVDMILGEGGTPSILEVNTIPGMTAVSLFPKAARAAGMSFDCLCSRLVELALDGNLRTKRFEREN